MAKEWEQERAERLRSAGVSYVELAAIFGVTPDTVHCRLEESYREKRKQRTNELRRIRNGTMERRTSDLIRHFDHTRAPVLDLVARLAEIPHDTRNLTGRICGDPLPGRSALDRSARLQPIEEQRT